MSDTALVAVASRLVAELPLDACERLAAAIGAAPSIQVARVRSTGLIAHPRFAERCSALFAAWEGCDDLAPPAVALALRTAALRTREERDRVQLEAVWTGPAVPRAGFRRTEQALLELIRRATKRLLLVSYAVYRHPILRGALIEAAARGVEIVIVVESPRESQGRMTSDALRGLGAQVVAASTVLVWPEEKRSRDANGNAGVLHAKCAVADDTMLLVSSANLTESAMTHNIELGLRLSGGPIPGLVATAFSALRTSGSLVEAR